MSALAGLFAGVTVGGVGSRLVMRASSLVSPDVSGIGVRSEQGFRIGEVTVGGTLALVIFLGIFVGVIGAVMYALTQPWLAWSGRWRGVLFGVFLFVVGSASSDALNPDNRDFFLLDRLGIVVVLFVALFIGFGVVMDRAYRWLDERLPEFDAGLPLVQAAYLFALAIAPVIGVGVITLTLLSTGNCDCEPSVVVGIGVVGLAAATVGTWIATQRSAGTRVTAALHVVGWLSLATAVTAGTIRAISDVVEILA